MVAHSTLLLLALFAASPPLPTDAEKELQLGQLAMERDRFEDAVKHFQATLRKDPKLASAHLSLAAAYLAQGRDAEAVPQLAQYLEARPDHFLVRMPYAEVLARLDRHAEAATQLEAFVAAVQDYPRLADEQLISCHTRLMELASKDGDDYGERLHRGIGLYLLAQKRADLGGLTSTRIAEELFCKAAGELTLARLQRPDEARPFWYLHGVWQQLGQRQPAERCLTAAGRNAGLSYLTPAEFRGLYLAQGLRELAGRKP